jgi:hypothetical protein
LKLDLQSSTKSKSIFELSTGFEKKVLKYFLKPRGQIKLRSYLKLNTGRVSSFRDVEDGYESEWIISRVIDLGIIS